MGGRRSASANPTWPFPTRRVLAPTRPPGTCRGQDPTRPLRTWLEAVAELLERRPARVGLELVVRMRLDVQVLAADGAEAGAVRGVQDLLGQLEGNRVARPGGQLELVV